MTSVIFHNNNKYIEYDYKLEKDYEEMIINNTKNLFGPSNIYIDVKAKINTLSLGGSIPDGMLFDLRNIDDPEFYLVEIELAKHDFYRHIFPQVTKFVAFYRNPKSQNELIEKLFELIQSDKDVENEFKQFLKGREIFKFIKDTIENSQNILIIIDNMKPELLEMTDTYTEWSKMVKTVVLKEYRCDENQILYLIPEFENVSLGETTTLTPEANSNDKIPPTEEYHLEGVDPLVKDIYQTIKHNLINYRPSLIFNPKKYYISIIDKRNFAFIYIRKKKVNITVIQPENVIRTLIKHHKIVTLSEGVQKFYGGKCSTIVIEDMSNFNEVIDLLKAPLK